MRYAPSSPTYIEFHFYLKRGPLLHYSRPSYFPHIPLNSHINFSFHLISVVPPFLHSYIFLAHVLTSTSHFSLKPHNSRGLHVLHVIPHAFKPHAFSLPVPHVRSGNLLIFKCGPPSLPSYDLSSTNRFTPWSMDSTHFTSILTCYPRLSSSSQPLLSFSPHALSLFFGKYLTIK
jgi:hypothetical protein